MGEQTVEARGLGARARRTASDPLLRSAYSLMLNIVLTSGTGVLFWIVAARLFPSSTVGRDSALVSAMIVIYMVCSLNLSSVIIRFLPVARMSPRRVVVGAYAVTVSLSAVGGTLFVVIAPRVSDGYAFLARSPWLAILYVAAVALWGVFALQDAVLTSLRRAPWVPIENGAFGVLKLLCLPIMLALGSDHGVFVAWVIPMVMLVIPVNYLIFGRVLRGRRPAAGDHQSPIERLGRRGLARFMAQDYAASVLMQAASTALPAILVGLLGSSTAAHFYMPFSIVAAFDLLFLNVTNSLTVEAAMHEERTPELTRTVIRRFGPLLALGVVVLAGAADWVLAPFGPEYVHHGATVLRLLAVASVFRGSVALFSALCRIEGDAAAVLRAQAATFVLVIGGTFLAGPELGLTGVGLAWLGANAIVALATLPRLIKSVRGGARPPRKRRWASEIEAA